MVRELVAAGYKGRELRAEVMRLTGLDRQNAAILIGIETGRGPFGDTDPPVRSDSTLLAQLKSLVAKRLQANP
jgi:hypothetical protein